MSQLQLMADPKPPGRVQFSKIKRDLRLLEDWQEAVSALPNSPYRGVDQLSGVLVNTARSLLDNPTAPAPLSASVMSLRDCHQLPKTNSKQSLKDQTVIQANNWIREVQDLMKTLMQHCN